MQQLEARQAEKNRKPKCPICGSEDLSKITATKKIMRGLLWGILAAGEATKTWQCNHCGSKF